MFAGSVVALFTASLALFSADKDSLRGSVILLPLAMYGMFLIAGTFSQQYIYAWTTNYCLNNSELGKIRVESTLNGGRLFWIRFSNIIAIVLSLGLLIPWAKVRRMRYIAENISVITAHDLDHFAATVEPEESSYGDAATDFFDFEIGL